MRQSSKLPFANPRRARIPHPHLLRHILGQAANLERWEHFASGCRHFANPPSKRGEVDWARNVCLGRIRRSG